MDDLRRRFATLDDVPVPDIWNEIERRVVTLGGSVATERLTLVSADRPGARDVPRSRPSTTNGRRRAVVLLVAAALLATALVGGALALGSGLLRLSTVVPPSPVATPATSPAPSPAERAPSPAVPSSARPAAAVPADPTMFATVSASRLVSDTVGWVATSAAIHRTTDLGRTWSTVRPTAATTSATAFVDPDTMYVASGGSPATIAATHDGGASWIEATLDVGAISGGPVFTFQTSQTGFATFYDPDGSTTIHVYRTDDGGVTWTGPLDGAVPHLAGSLDKLNEPIGGFLWQSAGRFDDQPFDERFYLSADGAVTWSAYTFPTGDAAPRGALKSIGAIVRQDDGRLLIAIAADDGSQSITTAVYESTDDPATWRLVRALPTGFDVQFLSPTTWILVRPDEVRSTVDGGAHWRTTRSSTPFRTIPQFATPDSGWMIVDCANPLARRLDPFCQATSQDTAFAVTGDGGATWTWIAR